MEKMETMRNGVFQLSFFQYFPPFLSLFLCNRYLSTRVPDPILSCFLYLHLPHQLCLLSSIFNSSLSTNHFLSDQIPKHACLHPIHFVSHHSLSPSLYHQTSWTQSHTHTPFTSLLHTQLLPSSSLALPKTDLKGHPMSFYRPTLWLILSLFHWQP